MRIGTFSGSLVFGAVAALASVAYLVAMRPLLGSALASSTYCVAAAVLYLVAMAPGWSRGIRIGFLAAILGGATLLFAPNAAVAVLGATVLLGLMRSGFLFRARPGRALLVELSLLAGGLLYAFTRRSVRIIVEESPIEESPITEWDELGSRGDDSPDSVSLG